MGFIETLLMSRQPAKSDEKNNIYKQK